MRSQHRWLVTYQRAGKGSADGETGLKSEDELGIGKSARLLDLVTVEDFGNSVGRVGGQFAEQRTHILARLGILWVMQHDRCHAAGCPWLGLPTCDRGVAVCTDLGLNQPELQKGNGDIQGVMDSGEAVIGDDDDDGFGVVPQGCSR